MEERKLLAVGDNNAEDVVGRNADKNEQCKSDLHRWITGSSPLRTCSLFSHISVKLVACGEGHLILVSNDFQVFSVGTNEYGQLGVGDRVDRKTPREVTFLSEKFVNRISSGSRHCCAISKKGQVFCWGDSRSGQCGQGEKGIFTTPCRVRFIDRKTSEVRSGQSSQKFIVAHEIACGDRHTLATDTQGGLWSWGSGLATGQGHGDEEILAPKRVKKLLKKRVIQIACGKYHSVALVQRDVNMNQDSLQNEVICSSTSDDGQDAISRSDSNVTQKIPFLENVFYVEEEDGPINWSMDLKKLSRSNTPVFLDESNSEKDEKSNIYTEEQSEASDKLVSVSEVSTEPEMFKDEDSHVEGKLISDGGKSETESATIVVNDAVEEAKNPKMFQNKLVGLTEETVQKGDVKGSKRASSLQDFDACSKEMYRRKSKSEDDLLNAKCIVDNSAEQAEDGGVKLLGGEKRKDPVSVSDVQLIEESTNDLYYSALDVITKQKKYYESKDSFTNTDSSSTTIDASCQSLNRERADASHNPLSLSIDRSMENMILSESCPVVVDESETEMVTIMTSGDFTDSDRDRSGSTWSIATTGSAYEVDKIGLAMLFGINQAWAWGENHYGQLGIGDSTLVIKESADPVLIGALKEEDIVFITAGSLHTLALTRSCQVFGWGDNSFGQLGIHENKLLQPQRISALKNVRVWDIAAGGHFSVFLADLPNSVCNMYQLGEDLKNLTENFLTVSNTSGSSSIKSKGFKKIRRSFHKTRRESNELMSAEWYMDSDMRKVEHFDRNSMLRTVAGHDNQFVCITMSDTDQLFKVMYKLASSERYYHYQLGLIQDYLMEPLQKTEQWTTVSKLPGGEALIPLIDCFNDVLLAIGVCLSQLTDTIKAGLRVKDLFSFFLSDSFRAGYERYSKCYSDTMAVGHLHSLSKSVGSIISKVKEPVKDVFHSLTMEQADLAALLKIPLTRTTYYGRCVGKIIRIMKDSGCAKSEEINQLNEVMHRWQDLSDHTSKRLQDAEKTREFWDESSTRLIEALKDPHRRVIRTSKIAPLSLARASRLTSHSFILFNDVFVHLQSSRHFQVFPLITMWVEPLLDSDQQRNSLRVTAPEASSVLISDSPFGRTEWVRELNEAIAQCLSVTSSHRITAQSVNSLSGLLRAADAREASYTYINHLKYKGAKYSGMWLFGLPHGRGRIEWPDGTVYEGEFEAGNFTGYGIMQFPVTTGDARQRYEGDWFEGKMRGFGQMTYSNGSEYIGQWNNDVRDGHGTLRTFLADRGLQTVYVGDWQNDQKNGYGVQDFVVRGEKYIGMWQNDQRHGYGIVVTVDGVYYEGRFLQNKLAGKGILLSDDDTCYEGEFTADMQLSGKGVLTLPNGDYIEGQFNGNWGEGIKVSGTFNKFANPDPTLSPVGEIGSSQLTVTDFTVPAGIKWKSLFKECQDELWGQMNCHDPEPTVEKNIEKSVMKTRLSDVRRRSTRRRGIEDEAVYATTKKQHVNCNDIKELQGYLTQAIDTFGHPFQILVEGLVEVYRATYVGVGAHRRLLLHAVEEAKSYVSRLFNVVRYLFPELPDEDYVMLTHDKANGVADHHINSSTLLHSLILPRLYPPLFTLYALHTEKADALYTERLHQLNKRGDIALMSFLGVNRKFLLCKFDEETKEPIVGETPPYQSAVAELELLSTKYSPMEKIDVIRSSFQRIYEEVDTFWQGQKKIVAMDDLFPVFQYVVTRARIPHLGSEIQFVEDLVDSSYLVGEMGHMLTTLKACYFQIQNERDRE